MTDDHHRCPVAVALYFVTLLCWANMRGDRIVLCWRDYFPTFCSNVIYDWNDHRASLGLAVQKLAQTRLDQTLGVLILVLF